MMNNKVPWSSNPLSDISPEDVRADIEAVARSMSPLSISMGIPVFPIEMINDIGKAWRTIIPADELIRELVNDTRLGARIINRILSAGVAPRDLWLRYNVWRVMNGMKPL